MTGKIVAVFFTAAALDAVWTCYIAAIAERRALAASAWNAVIIVLGGGLVLAYVREPFLVAVSAAGGFIGTYVVMRLKSTS